MVGWGTEECEMCDYSLHLVKSRAAKVGDLLTTRQFNVHTRGFCASEDKTLAVCVLPGTELSFAKEVKLAWTWPWIKSRINHKTAIFRQINQHERATHHDALEFPDGKIVLLTKLKPRQRATVLQLPAGAVELKDRQDVRAASPVES
jgi:hypothetical protein